MSPDLPGSGAGGHADGERDRQAQTGAQPQDQAPRQGVRVHTLVVAAVASGAAAVITSLFWKGGTIISAAIFATLVAFLRETLQRPASRIADVSKAKFADTLTPPKPHAPALPSDFRKRLAGWLAPARKERPAGSAPYTRIYDGGRVNFKAILLIAALAFLIAALVLTAAELAFGGAVSSNQSTTLFGGGSSAVHHPSTTPTTPPSNGQTQTSPAHSTSSEQTTQTGKTSQSSPSTTTTTPRSTSQPSSPQTSP